MMALIDLIVIIAVMIIIAPYAVIVVAVLALTIGIGLSDDTWGGLALIAILVWLTWPRSTNKDQKNP